MSTVLRDLLAEADQGWNQILSSRKRHPVTPVLQRPSGYHFSYRLGRPVPYQCCDDRLQATWCGGVLPAGSTIAFQHPRATLSRAKDVFAFTERTGLVRVNARELSLLDF